MKTKLLHLAFFSLSLVCSSASANWSLLNEQSSLNFVSTKNQHISEVMEFKKLEGELSSDGQLQLSIALASIDSGIEIRDTRMREKLFFVDQFPKAKLTAQLPKQVLKLAKGGSTLITLPAELSLLDNQKTIQVHVQVTRNADSGLIATSTQPILISASDFGLAGGVKALQEIAGLSSIGHTVPVSFNLVFKLN